MPVFPGIFVTLLKGVLPTCSSCGFHHLAVLLSGMQGLPSVSKVKQRSAVQGDGILAGSRGCERGAGGKLQHSLSWNSASK